MQGGASAHVTKPACLPACLPACQPHIGKHSHSPELDIEELANVTQGEHGVRRQGAQPHLHQVAGGEALIRKQAARQCWPGGIVAHIQNAEELAGCLDALSALGRASTLARSELQFSLRNRTHGSPSQGSHLTHLFRAHRTQQQHQRLHAGAQGWTKGTGKRGNHRAADTQGAAERENAAPGRQTVSSCTSHASPGPRPTPNHPRRIPSPWQANGGG